MPASSSFQTGDRGAPAVFGWDDCHRDVRDLVNQILGNYREILGENLTGFYLHGSLAMGCFNPTSSDIDFLATVKNKLTADQKKAIIDYLVKLREGVPVKGIEMSIVTEKAVKNLAYPTPYELHYSVDWYRRYKNGEVDLSTPSTDEDLVGHFTVIRQRGICIYGRTVDEMFPEIPEDIYIRFLKTEARWIYERTEQDPVYTVLNLCRILAFLREGKIISKQEGGAWALTCLPAEYSPLIEAALDCYAGTSAEMEYDRDTFARFLEHCRSEIGPGEGGS